MYCSYTKVAEYITMRKRANNNHKDQCNRFPSFHQDTSHPLAKGKGLCAGGGKRQIESERIPVPEDELPKTKLCGNILGLKLRDKAIWKSKMCAKKALTSIALTM